MAPDTAAACDHTDHRVNDRGERQGQIARTAWEPCATAAHLTFRTNDGARCFTNCPACRDERDGLTCSSCGATGIKGQAEAAVHAIRRDGKRVCDAK